MNAVVNNIIPTSSVDGPGNRTAIFLQGCNYNCGYCHNPETINLCINCGECVEVCLFNALELKDGAVLFNRSLCQKCDECLKICQHNSSPRVDEMSANDVIKEVEKNIPFIKGITVSGGEATLYRDFLVELFTLAKERDLSTLIDSNGSFDFSKDSELLSVVDGVMLDVKAWDSEEHQKLCGVKNDVVLKNLSFLAKTGKLEEVRTVVVPNEFNVSETIENVCRTIFPHLSIRDVRYKIIKYRPFGVREQYKSFVSPTDSFLLELEQKAHSLGVLNTVVI